MFRRIIVGCDGGERGRNAVRAAATIADVTGASLHLVAAYAQQPLPYVDSTTEMRRRTEVALRAIRDELAPDALASVAGAFSPAHALCHVAEQRAADLIVVGSSHHGRLNRLLDADHALQVLHSASCAVAVVPDDAPPRGELRRIVVGLDASPEALRAAGVACDLARRAGASVHLLVGVPELVVDWPSGVGLVPPFDETGIPPAARKDAEALLRRTIEALGGVDLDGDVAVGDPADMLARASATADLVVVGSRRWGPVRRVLLGSVSEAVVRRACGPVLVVARGANAGEPPVVEAAEAVATP